MPDLDMDLASVLWTVKMTDLHTYCICKRCGATIRASRHSDSDCDTIKELRGAWWKLNEMITADRAELILNDLPPEHLDSDPMFAVQAAYARFKEISNHANP